MSRHGWWWQKDGLPSFADGTRIDVNAVTWAVGYRDDFGWLGIPEARDAEGKMLHMDASRPFPAHLCRPAWQRNRTSALVMGIGDDAAAIVQHIVSAPTWRDLTDLA
ncbi:hypothetical protein [Mesorhizobium australicum]|uniref:hypothetical protein n=1 Tax=Mesorhizobium australicum TaxID=536018 RepID=UPI000A1C8A99|nr:hypothetical protein [Mesorhizobium australicum]